jgi:hypothetical protein
MRAFTSSTVSMTLKPLRLTICSATVGSPLKRAVPSRSSKVRRMSARSPSVTTLSPLTWTGRVKRSSGVSKAEGTLTAKAPEAASMSPAAISWLLRLTARTRSSAVRS